MSRLSRSRIAFLAAFVVLVVTTALVGHRLAMRAQSDLTCLVEDTCTGGGSGIREWAERLGYSTDALRAPLRDIAAELPTTGNCLITAGNGDWDPLAEEFAADDWSRLDQWIQSGNTLIVITSDPSSLPSPLREHFTSELPAADADEPLPPTIKPSKKRLDAFAGKQMARVPTWWGGGLAVDANGPRVSNLPEEFQLAGRGTTTVLAGKPLGEGMVYLLLDESAWTNGGFDQADNAAALARILHTRLGPQGVLAFDEYRHGYGHVKSFTTVFMSLPGAKDFVAMALLWGLFSLWGSTRRLSPPDEYREIERRTALEYIESAAAMNQRARAAPLAVSAVMERVRYLLQKRGISPDSATAVFDRAAKLVKSAERPAVPKQEIELVRDILQLKQEYYGTRRDPRAQ